MSIDVVLVAAIGDDGVIGRDGAMPWRLSSDLRRFKQNTMGKPLVLGRKTYESIGKPLPGRVNIVITREAGYDAPGCEVVAGIDEALILARARAEASGADEICVIGGGEIYRQTLDGAGRLYITHVDGCFEGDTVFPEIRPEQWQIVRQEAFPAGEKDSHATRYVVYERAP